ncbi:MAG: hypothetical protein KKH98_08245 [Spirochaetes bacterium]|nr:hypothetical protein [Spirochaetota bacterium]
MKKLGLIIFIILFSQGMLFSQLYFNLGIEEGVILSSGEYYTINDITSDVAYMIPFNKNNSLMAYYQLKYNGPSVGDNADARFSERAQDHYFLLKYLLKVNNSLALKPSVSFFKEFYKFAKNEVWGEGLYDLNKYQFGIDIVSKGISTIPLTLIYKYQMFKYPNYHDLLTMYLTSFQDKKEIENYRNHLISLSISEASFSKPLFINFIYDLNLSSYDNKKILEATGYSGNDKQKGVNHSINLGPVYRASSTALALNFGLELNDSNQNYIFGYTSTDIQLYSDYYSYTSFNVKPSITFMLSKIDYLALLFGYINKQYKNRSPQDSNGVFLLDSNLKTQSLSAGLSYFIKLSDYFSLNPEYLYVKSDSNNKYQQSVNYNYDAHLITLKLNYEY